MWIKIRGTRRWPRDVMGWLTCGCGGWPVAVAALWRESCRPVQHRDTWPACTWVALFCHAQGVVSIRCPSGLLSSGIKWNTLAGTQWKCQNWWSSWLPPPTAPGELCPSGCGSLSSTRSCFLSTGLPTSPLPDGKEAESGTYVRTHPCSDWSLSWNKGFERLKTLWMPPGFLPAGPFPCSPVWFFKLAWQHVQAVKPVLWKRNNTLYIGNN